MTWQTSKIRDITLMERILKLRAFLAIGPGYPDAKFLKERINAHLEKPNNVELANLVEEIDTDFLPDYGCSHTEQRSERRSECARKRGQQFVTDCECGFCKAINDAWLSDEWGSGDAPLAEVQQHEVSPLGEQGDVIPALQQSIQLDVKPLIYDLSKGRDDAIRTQDIEPEEESTAAEQEGMEDNDDE